MAGLIKENWETTADKQFYQNIDWTNALVDKSDAIEGSVLNLIKAGATPSVLVNNNSWPIAISAIADTATTITLDRLDTTPTVIHDWQAKQFSYNKMESDTEGHALALNNTASERGAYNVCQASHVPASGRFKLQASGAAFGGRATLTFDDVSNLQLLFNTFGVPVDGRTLVLSHEHAMDLTRQDRVALNQLADHKNGIIGRIYGFDLYSSGHGAVYESATGTKQALGAAPAAGFYRASFAFQKRTVLKAFKPIKAFYTIDDPTWRGTILGFNKDAIIIPRQGGIATIFS